MSKNKILKLIKVAKMYYQLGYSQLDIAKELGISRPSVSRLLQDARENGIVHIKVVDPFQGVQELSETIKEKFQLKECIVVNIPIYEESVVKGALGQRAAEYLREIVKDGDIIGATWGTTIYEIARSLLPKNVADVSIVQLNGGISYSETNTYSAEILNYLGTAFNTSPHFLPVPAIVDHSVVKQAIVADRHIRHVLELGKRSNIALFTVGGQNEESTLIKTDYFTEQELKVLENKNAVGDICSRFIDIEGEICNTDLDARTIGIDLDELSKKEYAILVAGGHEKATGIIGALRGKYSNVLITDQYTAEALIEHQSMRGIENDYR